MKSTSYSLFVFARTCTLVNSTISAFATEFVTLAAHVLHRRLAFIQSTRIAQLIFPHLVV